MKIKKADNTKIFDNVALGEVFKIGGKVFIRVKEVEGKYGRINAIDLENGSGTNICINERVDFLPNAELTL